MRNKLFKIASVIHVVKCKKAVDFIEATASFEKLQSIKISLHDLNEEDFTTIQIEIEKWKKSNPIASENEIKEILK